MQIPRSAEQPRGLEDLSAHEFTGSLDVDALRRPRAPHERDAHEIMELRNALKLAGKVMGGAGDGKRNCGLLHEARRAETAPVAAGFLLTLTAEPHDLILAAFLHDAYRAFPGLRTKIERSFGSKVLDLLDGEGSVSYRRRTKLEQALAFAAESAAGDFQIALRQYGGFDDAPYTLREIEQIQRALLFAGDLYDGARRSWGAHERLPMFTHAADVGLLLALSAAPAQVIEAGILHDALEGYNMNGRSRADVRRLLQQTFEAPVAALVEALTEPREREGWQERKLRVVSNVAAICRRDAECGR